MERRSRHYFLSAHNDDDRIISLIEAGKQSKTGLRILALLLAERRKSEQVRVWTAFNARDLSNRLQCSRQAAEKAIHELRAEHLLTHTYGAFRPEPRTPKT